MALDSELKKLGTEQDKAFVQAICFGVCRYYHRLDFVLSLLIDKPVKVTDVKSLLLVGLFQIGYMRVKPHAAVSETVQAAKKVAWAKGLINAVLRNYLRRQGELDRQANEMRAAAYSHPVWMMNALMMDWPDQVKTILNENNRTPPMSLRVNIAKQTREGYLKLLQDAGIIAQPATIGRFGIMLDTPVPVDVLPGFNEGWVSVQDIAAQLAAELLDLHPGQRVLDVCAAPGGKTAHIAEMEPNLAALAAVDIDANRMTRVRENLERIGKQAELMIADAACPDQWWDGREFDRILLDAPCSATGVIRRHPDIKLLRREEDIGALVQQQSAILNAVWPMLKPGGILVYATCSMLKRENAGQIEAFLAAHEDAGDLPIISADWGCAQLHGRQILTGDDGMDGFYYARLYKR